MKKLVSALATLLLALAVGCSEESKAAASSAVQGLDLSKLSIDEMKTNGTAMVGDVVAKLSSLKDVAGVASMTKDLEPLLGNLGMLKDKLGATGLDLSSISNAISDLTSKFSGDMKMMDALKPLLDKVQTLMK